MRWNSRRARIQGCKGTKLHGPFQLARIFKATRRPSDLAGCSSKKAAGSQQSADAVRNVRHVRAKTAKSLTCRLVRSRRLDAVGLYVLSGSL